MASQGKQKRRGKKEKEKKPFAIQLRNVTQHRLCERDELMAYPRLLDIDVAVGLGGKVGPTTQGTKGRSGKA